MSAITKRKNPTTRKANEAKLSSTSGAYNGPTPAELKAFAEMAFRDASSGKNSEAIGLASLIRETLHTADLFDELEALNIATARTFHGVDKATRVNESLRRQHQHDHGGHCQRPKRHGTSIHDHGNQHHRRHEERSLGRDFGT